MRLTPVTGRYGIVAIVAWPIILATQQYKNGEGLYGILRALTGVELAYQCVPSLLLCHPAVPGKHAMIIHCRRFGRVSKCSTHYQVCS